MRIILQSIDAPSVTFVFFFATTSSMPGWPKEIHELINKTFGNDSKKAYGQISSVDQKGRPSVCTVHLHVISNPQAIVASSNIKSAKWANLQKNPVIAGCFWNPENQIQIRMAGTSQLITKQNKDYAAMVLSMWKSMREEVRITYLLDDAGTPLDIKKPQVNADDHSENHGVILIHPTTWDVFQNNTKEYRFGKRSIYMLKNQEWIKREVTPLHENP